MGERGVKKFAPHVDHHLRRWARLSLGQKLRHRSRCLDEQLVHHGGISDCKTKVFFAGIAADADADADADRVVKAFYCQIFI